MTTSDKTAEAIGYEIAHKRVTRGEEVHLLANDIATAIRQAHDDAIDKAESCAHREEPRDYNEDRTIGYLRACEDIIADIRKLKHQTKGGA